MFGSVACANYANNTIDTNVSMDNIESVGDADQNGVMPSIIIRDIDPVLRKRLRMVCLHREKSVNATLKELIAEYVQQQEKRIERERKDK